MGFGDLFKEFDWAQFAIFVAFALPGFISLQIWTLIVPSSEKSFLDRLPEAIAFGVLNAAVVGPVVLVSSPKELWQLYGLLVAGFVVVPAIWPLLLRPLLRWLHRSNVILNPTHNGWDAAFLQREPFFVIVHLTDGRRVGGYYGYRSYAGVYPASGHLYLESLWSLDAAGKFLSQIPGSRGIVLRPEDYHFVELLQVPKE